jgi:hypothetical protein
MSPELLFWCELALKMAMTATIVVAASVAVEHTGAFLGALIATLPTAAGAAYIILAIEHPPAFVAASHWARLPPMRWLRCSHSLMRFWRSARAS